MDTTTDVRSVAVVCGGRVRAQVAGSLRGAHSANLLSDIDGVLKQAGVRLAEIELLAAATGPGSFTGLRAGLATVKAFAVALAKPVVGVPTLHAVALSAGRAGHVVAALPAGRGELFAQLLSVAPDGAVTELDAPAHLPPAALVERALSWSPSLTWIGTGAHAQRELIKDAATRAEIVWQIESDKAGEENLNAIEQSGQSGRVWLLARPTEALAGEVARLALRAYEAGGTGGAEDLRALYVRLSDAELNERCPV